MGKEPVSPSGWVTFLHLEPLPLFLEDKKITHVLYKGLLELLIKNLTGYHYLYKNVTFIDNLYFI